MMKCAECHEIINATFPDWRCDAWKKLVHYFDHELSEEEITEATYMAMMDALMSVKPKESE